jgi:RNA polymerase subunit RPABC4/transcription elongation factor Spt4
MSRFRDELSVIPRVAWLIAAGIYLGLAVVLLFVVIRSEAGAPPWPLAAKIPLAVLGSAPLAIYALLIGYVYADAKRRGMRHVMWTWLAALIPNAIGIILYFVLRDPLLEACPNCAALARGGFAFCPQCGSAISRACPECRRAVEPGWTHCPYCGATL